MYPRSHTERGDEAPPAAVGREAFLESIDATAPFDPDESTVLDVADPDDEPTRLRPPPPLGSPVADAVAPAPRRRRRLGKYQLLDKLGSGAFGVVYTARDPRLDREVAIKVLRPAHLGNPTIVQRFLQEARATARIAHPGIVTIHDCGQVETSVGATAYIAMELLSGESLATRLARSGRMAPVAAIELVRQAASALEAAHRADVLHRDLKPDNLYLVADPAIPSGERVKVLDFGLAKLGHDGHTQLKTVFGTPRYMSPEQGRSTAQVDHRSDVYSLGCILFELATGAAPFDGDTRQLLEHHQRTPAPRARSLAPELPAALDELIAEMLAKDPMDRPQTMGAVQRGLQRAHDALVEAAFMSAPVRPSSPPARASSPRPPSAPGAHPRPASAPGAHPRPASAPGAPPRAATAPGAHPRPATSPGPDRALAPEPARVPAAPPASPEAASGEILVLPSGSRPVLTAEQPAPPPAVRLSSAKLLGLGALVFALSALVAWITG